MMHSISSQAPQGSRWLWRALAGLALLMLAALLTAAVLLWVNRASLRNWLRPQLSRWGLERVVVREVKVPVMVEKKVEVIREVPVADPLPSQFVPRQEVDVASLFNGIEIATELKTLPGGFASLERLNPKAYQAQFQLQVRVPKANASMEGLSTHCLGAGCFRIFRPCFPRREFRVFFIAFMRTRRSWCSAISRV